MRDDVFVYLHQLPEGVHECVCPCEGGYNITIDPRQSHDGILRSYRHAMKHINNHDFERKDVNEVELKAHMK